MFTGIVADIGTVLSSDPGNLQIGTRLASSAELGDSVAVDGVDLTVASKDEDYFTSNVMPETVRRSNLGRLQRGDSVNLELSVRALDRLSGHLVRGVVEGRARLCERRPDGEAVWLEFECEDPELTAHMVVKGPVAVDGVSLTITEIRQETFAISMVQFTAERTTLGSKQVGAILNVETDILARYVESAVAHRLGQFRTI